MTSSAPNAVLRFAQRVVIRTARGPLFRAWACVYRGVAWATARYLTWGEHRASSYVRSGMGHGELVPGISDIDLAFVLEDDPGGPDLAAGRVRDRYDRLVMTVPLAGRVIDVPGIYEQSLVEALAGSTFATWGLDGTGLPEPVYRPGPARLNRCRLLERPGLYDDFEDWRLRSGPERLPRPPARDRDSTMFAAWMELSFWWRFAFEASLEPGRIHVPRLCVKLVAESARTRLWLETDERLGSRSTVLERMADAHPEEAEVVNAMRSVLRGLHRFPEPPVALALGALLRQTQAVAELVTAHALSRGAVDVDLLGTTPIELADSRTVTGPEEPPVPHPVGALPICDWRGLAAPDHIEDGFVVGAGSARDPAAVAAAADARRGGSYTALREANILLFPLPLGEAPKPRRLACAASDPVSFALLGGQAKATFSLMRGWAPGDVARRAIVEQGPRIAEARKNVEQDPGRSIRGLLSAARAAMFLESLDAGAPRLAVTMCAVADQLSERGRGDVGDEARAVLRGSIEARPSIAAALLELVDGLPAFASPVGGQPR